MKLLLVALAVLSFTSAHADNHMEKISYDGHLQLRVESANNRRGVQGSKQSEQTFYRFRTNIDFKASDKVSLRLSPQATKDFGGNHNAMQTQHSDLSFYEASLKYNMTSRLSMNVGRQMLAYGDHFIIGSLPWLNTARSFDALKFNYQYTGGQLDVAFAKADDNSTNQIATDDKNMYYAYNKYSVNDYLKELDTYFIHVKDQTSTTIVESNSIGLRIKGSANNIFYRTENVIQAGGNVGDDAFAYDFEVGYKHRLAAVSFMYSMAGKDYQQLYPTAHKFLGYADVFGRRNIDAMALRIKSALTEKLTLKLDYHTFKRNDTSAPAYYLNGSTSWETTSSSSDDLGTEIDVVMDYKLDTNLKIQLGAAFFTAKDYMKEQQNNQDDKTRFLYTQLNATF